MSGYAWLLVAVPLLTAAGGLLTRGRRAAGWLAVGGGIVTTVVAGVLFAGDRGSHEVAVIAPTPEIAVALVTTYDGLAALVAVMVAVVSLLVQVYSREYLHDDARYRAYAAQVSLFTAAMLLVVVAADLLVLLVGWEVMGLCSYLLIGHYREQPDAPPAAVKAFILTRVGDVGFLLGILLLGAETGSFAVADVLAALPSMSSGLVTAAALLLLLGVAGKSAQFPLHTWLPDAMAGPTPISALIHAATMVAAGVYVVLRLYPVFAASPAALAAIGVVAAVTMLLGALAALAQDDVKRVLAWSTVSQLAYMVGALAVGGWLPATYHLITHAAFKALLFLCAGVLLHAVGTASLAAMGGLRRRLPVTFVAMLVGGLALAGVVPLSGGWSKESVLEAGLHAVDGESGVDVPLWTAWLVLIAGFATVVLTAAYVTRALLMAFAGPDRTAEGTSIREPGWLMRGPVVVLAALAAVLGLLGPALQSIVDPPDGLADQVASSTGLLIGSLALVALGGVAVWLVWRRDPAADPIRILGSGAEPLRRAFYVDDVQNALVVRPVTALARALTTVDTVAVDGAVDNAGKGVRAAGGALSGQHPKGAQLAVTGLLVGTLLVALAVAVSS